MKASLLYRIAAILLLLFAGIHTFGFRQSDPSWGVDAMLGSMRSMHFNVLGIRRSYWDFFVADGLTVAVFYFFSAVLAWQLSRLPVGALTLMRGITWAFAIVFAAITVVSCLYLFIPPIVFSSLITMCLMAAAWTSGKQVARA